MQEMGAEREAAIRTSLSSARWALQEDNGPRPHMGRGFEAADWQLGWWIERAWNGGVKVGQFCLCQLIKSGMLTSFQNKMQLKYSLDGI